jgi:hypothetical protein
MDKKSSNAAFEEKAKILDLTDEYDSEVDRFVKSTFHKQHAERTNKILAEIEACKDDCHISQIEDKFAIIIYTLEKGISNLQFTKITTNTNVVKIIPKNIINDLRYCYLKKLIREVFNLALINFKLTKKQIMKNVHYTDPA